MVPTSSDCKFPRLFLGFFPFFQYFSNFIFYLKYNTIFPWLLLFWLPNFLDFSSIYPTFPLSTFPDFSSTLGKIPWLFQFDQNSPTFPHGLPFSSQSGNHEPILLIDAKMGTRLRQNCKEIRDTITRNNNLRRLSLKMSCVFYHFVIDYTQLLELRHNKLELLLHLVSFLLMYLSTDVRSIW